MFLFLSLHSPSLFYFSTFSIAPCCLLSIRTMAARWCGLRLRPAPLLLRASTVHCAVTLHQSVGAVWAPTPHTIILCVMSRWSSTVKCPSLVEQAAMGITMDRAPWPLLATTMTQQFHLFAGEEGRWITGMSSWPIRHISCTTHPRPRGSSGSEYSYPIGNKKRVHCEVVIVTLPISLG